MVGLSLSKGQSLSLTKSDGSALKNIIVGLGWDPAFGGREIDLDASVILFDAAGKNVDTVWYGSTKSKDRAVLHSGDNLTGAGDGDDEQIRVDLDGIDPRITAGVVVITSYTKQKFAQVKNVYARVVDASAGGDSELVRYNLAGDNGDYTASVIAKFERDGAGWKFTAVGNPANGHKASKVVADAQRVL
jgi:tellurium resistance protein TerZ